MLFNFSLTELDKIPPWGRGDDLHLSWYGLTDGCYWLRPGDVELFRYSEALLEKDLPRDDYAGCGPYVDYHVVRLWEDILDILPDVLSPVPAAAANKLAASSLQIWRATYGLWMDKQPFERSYALDEAVTEWIRERHLFSSHLKASPRIWLWNDGTHIHIEWDNRNLQIDGVLAWSAQMGSWALTVETFLEEVRAFDSALFLAMQHRVEQIIAGWGRPGVYIDTDHLIWEQADRATWLKKSLDRAQQKPSPDWSAILNAIAVIEAESKS